MRNTEKIKKLIINSLNNPNDFRIDQFALGYEQYLYETYKDEPKTYWSYLSEKKHLIDIIKDSEKLNSLEGKNFMVSAFKEILNYYQI